MTPLTAMTSKASVALMKFLSQVATQRGVGKHIYVVGGAVRNFVIDQPIKDIDVVVDSVALGNGRDSAWFAEQVKRAIPAQCSLTTNQYGVAILTVNSDWWVEGENMVGETIEIANARKESYGGAGGQGYKPHMVEPATVEEDVFRREFTFNTLMWRLQDLAHGPDKAEIVDITGCGLHDLQQGDMRCPSDPDKTFLDDPTRMLRAIKFLNKYNLKPTPDTLASIKRNAPALKNAPYNAIGTLLIDTILVEPTAKKALVEMRNLGLLEVVKDMIQTVKPFKAMMVNWANNQKLSFLYEMLDFDLSLADKLNFLTPDQQTRLRKLVVQLPEGEPEQLVEVLKQPGKALDSQGLITEFNLVGPQIKKLTETARALLLDDPDLMHDPRALTEEVRRRLGGNAPGRVACQFLKKSGYFGVGDFILYGKWKNKKGKIVAIGQDKHGNPTVEIEPIPKGRKQNKVFGLFRIWHDPSPAPEPLP